MASEKAKNYTNELCIKCPDKMYCHKKCQEYKYSCEVFDAGVASVPSDAELVDELQALKEELKRIKEEHKVQESAELHQLKEKLKWHNPEELPIQQENEVKKLFLIKFTMNHSDEIHVGCGYFSFSLNKFTFPVSFIFQDTCKLISWKEIE